MSVEVMQLKASSSSSSSPSMKLKTLIQNLLAHPLYRFLRAVSRAKSIFLEISKHNNKKRKLTMFYPRKASKNQRKIFFGSFRLHYNWCSSDVVPVPQPLPFSVSDINGVEDDESQLSGYLEWFEHKKVEDLEEIRDVGEVDDDNHIDHFAGRYVHR